MDGGRNGEKEIKRKTKKKPKTEGEQIFARQQWTNWWSVQFISLLSKHTFRLCVVLDYTQDRAKLRTFSLHYSDIRLPSHVELLLPFI